MVYSQRGERSEGRFLPRARPGLRSVAYLTGELLARQPTKTPRRFSRLRTPRLGVRRGAFVSDRSACRVVRRAVPERGHNGGQFGPSLRRARLVVDDLPVALAIAE